MQIRSELEVDIGGTATPAPSTTHVTQLLADLGEQLAAADTLRGAPATHLVRLAADVEQARRLLDWYAGEVAIAFDRARRDADRLADVSPRRVGSTVASELALARTISPAKAARDLQLAAVAAAELPHTWAALRAARVPLEAVRAAASATAMLSADDRRVVDEQLAGDPQRLHGLSLRALEAQARRLAYSADPHAYVAARARAEQERFVSVRPVPDLMIQLTAMLPVAQGVAVQTALVRAAQTARAAGDPRTRAQVMADTLVERVTGQSSAPEVPLAVDLVLPLDTLLGGTQPADLTAPGLTPEPVPAPMALDLVEQALGVGAEPTVRRLFTAPAAGELVAMESRRRLFPRQLADLVRRRDRCCATPWCGAPIRHIDHVVPHVDDGSTSVENAAGRCERCNHVKQHPLWREHRAGQALHITPPSTTRCGESSLVA